MEAICPQPGTTQTFGPEVRPKSDLWIYFKNVASKRIKIGKSGDARGARDASLRQTPLGEIHIETICEVKGQDSDEKFLHRYFKHIRIEREYFEPSDDLIDYIRWLMSMNFVSTKHDTDAERDAKPRRTFDEWMPTAERKRPRPTGILPCFLGDFGLEDVPNDTADDFYTNEIIISAARDVMGVIDLDPASHIRANEVVRAKKYFTFSDDGLRQLWAGKVWCNPPFSRWSEWSPKIVQEWRSGRIAEMCVLLATRTLTRGYLDTLLQETKAMCITKGRIPFWGPKATNSPDDGHAILYMGGKVDAFKCIGSIFYGVKQ